MENEIILRLPNPLYRRVRALATQRQQGIAETVLDIFTDALPYAEKTESPVIDLTEPDEDVDREMMAYIKLHPTLKEIYPGQYVAIYQGKLVDHDADLQHLTHRINHQYGAKYVWISKVEPEAIPTRRFRSPKFVKE